MVWVWHLGLGFGFGLSCSGLRIVFKIDGWDCKFKIWVAMMQSSAPHNPPLYVGATIASYP